MNVKKQLGHERCNGVSGIILFDSTNAIIENCLYSSGCSIANVSGNSKCEAVNILTELYKDEYVSPTDKNNAREERYTRTVNCIQHYFMLWKNSNCEYLTNSSNSSKQIEVKTYNVEDSSYIDDKSTWVYVEHLADNYWNGDSQISTIYQQFIAERGSITDFPECKPLKVYVSNIFTEDRPVLDIGLDSGTDQQMYLNLTENVKYTSCVQMLAGSKEPNSTVDADDVSNTFVVWSSFLYTDGNEIKWSKFPNVVYNVDFNIHITQNNVSTIFSLVKTCIPKNLKGHTLNMILEENINISDVSESSIMKVCDYFNGEIVFNGNGKSITYAGKYGIVFSNIQFLTIKNLTIKSGNTVTNIKSNLFDEYYFNVCLKCVDVDNLDISGCTVENKMVYTFDDITSSTTANTITSTVSFNAGCIDNIKKSSKTKTVGIYLTNCKGVINNCNFTNSTIGLCVDQNSNVYIEKRSVSDYCIFKNTSSNTQNIYKMIGCCRVAMTLFYVTGNSKLSTNITNDTPIRYNETGQDISVTKYTEFEKNENFTLSVCDPGSLFDHDFKHEDYDTISDLLSNHSNVLNYGECTDCTADPTRVTIFANSKSGSVDYSNNLKELNSTTFTADSTVTASIANDWYWYSNVSEKPGFVNGSLSTTSFCPIMMDTILYNSSGYYGYRMAMVMNSTGNIDQRGIEKSEYVLQ